MNANAANEIKKLDEVFSERIFQIFLSSGAGSVKGHGDLLFSSGSCYNFVYVVLFELLQRFNEKSENSKNILFCFHEVIELFKLHAGYTFVTDLKFLIKSFFVHIWVIK